ncbi:hypothetical protein F7725_004066 [Dissostichus mawsoni]|uniref:PIH1 domain-containing protein 1 n=1 Tax=Dissostichus mawsoni TaxID=36200 RepID=A0A7J5YFB2_DISMA|nr:hypothetical protein F7725_004066 [Dissostichus mawsoni]
MCVKTITEPDKQKIFVNVCQSPVVPLPPEISRDELVDLLQSEDPSGFRVPMSLGEPHTETDNNSQACTAYDVVINQEFFQKCQTDPLFQQFVILVSLEGLENKYNLELSRDWKVLKNRKFLGSLVDQNIRTKSRPVQLHCCSYKPPAGDPEFLIAEIKLPGVRSSRSLVLDLGEDRLLLTARPSLYLLDIFHPFSIEQESSVAQSSRSPCLWCLHETTGPHGHHACGVFMKLQVLTVTMPVVSS